ncbi:hypothetical protein [Paracidovorax avenae]|uniref:hypothetical protein n=1 Tax=Paracidovorax avenae TaxID=80867 RepID=UPI000D204545|nr:hypothetical protein [Paracidovorax avenae]AVT13641.1 hypothetical protein C8235_12670 [Paracidovorax avenae]
MSIDSVIQDDWASEPSVMQVCLHVWHALSAREQPLDHYTFDHLLQLSQVSDGPLVSRALSYLATPRLKVLKTCLMYEFDGGFYELPEDEVRRYSRGEAVIHPEFGEPIPEVEIMICFTPGSALKNKGASVT